MSSEFHFIAIPGGASPEDESPCDPSEQEQQPNQNIEYVYKDNISAPEEEEAESDEGPDVQRISMEQMMGLLNSIMRGERKVVNGDNFMFRVLSKGESVSTQGPRYNRQEAEELELKNYKMLVASIIKAKADDMTKSTKLALDFARDNPELFQSFMGKVGQEFCDLLPYQIAMATAQAYVELAKLSLLITKNLQNPEDSDFKQQQAYLQTEFPYYDSIINLIQHEAL